LRDEEEDTVDRMKSVCSGVRSRVEYGTADWGRRRSEEKNVCALIDGRRRG
jgi:hypothetical protein